MRKTKYTPDMSGMIFGRLTVVSRAENSPGGSGRWNCRCQCGGSTISHGYSLRAGRSNSCGCIVREWGKTGKAHRIHGQTNTGEHKSWAGMLDRCNNHNNPNYNIYGGRGIRVCSKWNNFEEFLNDMGPRPSSKHSIDRFPNKDGNYEPDNCRWATSKQQNQNRRNNKMVCVNGVIMSLAEACDKYDTKYSMVILRLRRGWDDESAIKTPRLR